MEQNNYGNCTYRKRTRLQHYLNDYTHPLQLLACLTRPAALLCCTFRSIFNSLLESLQFPSFYIFYYFRFNVNTFKSFKVNEFSVNEDA